MNRLHHLKQTYIRNITEQPDFCEFVLLDYGSSDGLADWAKKLNKVTYYRFESSNYHSSHAKNVAATLASHDIICNLDADNHMGEGFAENIIKLFSRENVFASETKNHNVAYDLWGFVTCRRKDFLSVNGYNEKLVDYGYDDVDFCNRLSRVSVEQVGWHAFYKGQPISHGNDERSANFSEKDVFVSNKRNINMANDCSVNSSSFWGAANLVKNFLETVTTQNGCLTSQYIRKQNVPIF